VHNPFRCAFVAGVELADFDVPFPRATCAERAEHGEPPLNPDEVEVLNRIYAAGLLVTYRSRKDNPVIYTYKDGITVPVKIVKYLIDIEYVVPVDGGLFGDRPQCYRAIARCVLRGPGHNRDPPF
jgi:hypothetical protein